MRLVVYHFEQKKKLFFSSSTILKWELNHQPLKMIICILSIKSKLIIKHKTREYLKITHIFVMDFP